MSLLFLLPLSLLLLFPSSLSSPSSYPFNTAYYIDCGGPTNSTDKFNTTWLSDRFYTAGSTGLVSEPLLFQNPQEKTLRFFPIASGKKNCYVIPVQTGRFYLRTFTVYDNYDGKARAPSFDMSVEGTLVFSWRSPWPEDISRSGAYSDLFAFISDGEADVCFYSIATDSPVIGSLELVQIDPDSYDSASIGNDSVLVNYGRLSFGSGQWGPGFNNDIDLFGRSWQSDAGFRSRNSVGVKRVSVVKNVNNTDQSPNYFPMKLYQSAVTVIGNGELEYELPVDAKMDYLVWFHFAEIDSGVTKSGQRVFDVLVNDKNVSRVDIFSEVGSFSAYSLHYTVKNLSSTSLIVKLSPVVGAPIISGLENYAIVPADLSTVPDQVVAMRALKDSLRVPDRMGWNGDPCAPTNWDAWEGVTCYPSKNKLSLVISHIDLGSQGLKGYISDQIGLLSNLVSLNLSTNFLGGTLPLGLGQKSLIKLDLSNNRFTGSIPDSLASSNLQLVLLNDNLLEGRVPEELYSVGVHGGSIDELLVVLLNQEIGIVVEVVIASHSDKEYGSRECLSQIRRSKAVGVEFPPREENSVPLFTPPQNQPISHPASAYEEVALHGFGGSHSVSLFLLTKGGNLVERRLHQRKWKWIVHGSPENHHLSSITSVSQDEFNEKTSSLFLTTASGSVLEYRVPKYSGSAQDNQIEENWVSHTHPPHAKLARGISGMQFQVGRIIFPLDDGRLAELHLPGLGGETAGPNYQINVRRKASLKYAWSILDSPETEGWNAEYCTEERGPTNCIMGIKDEPSDENVARSMSRGRKGSKEQQNYLSLGSISSSDPRPHTELYNMPANWINMNFRLRVMQGGRSFFLITDSGLTFEYLNTENVWIWLRHEHTTAMKGAVGYYNGSLFLVDEHGSLLIRERNSDGLAWINCTAMKKARPILGGPPWDKLPEKGLRVTAEDALFFVSKTGRLLQFTVALRKFKWKDCRNPPNTKVVGIVDQEIFRENIVFVIGRNGRLYQYNKVSEIWHEHRQSQHLVLSRLPGTAMRPSSLSLTGSLFMLSEDGGLVEYHWNGLDGWNWVEHGTPHRSVTLVGSPGPCFQGNQLFLIGSDGNVYLRYLDQTTWKWKNCGFPYMESTAVEDQRPVGNEETCVDEDFATSFEKNDNNQNTFNGNCDSKVAPIRPIPFAEDSVVFELKDGRLAEMQRMEKKGWLWTRTMGTPTSLCLSNFWTGLAS